MTLTTQVMIVGAGPTGLTLAVVLRRHGIDCVVVERAAAPHRQSRGKGLQPRTLEILTDLGVLPEVLAHGEHRQVVTIYKGHRRLGAIRVGTAKPRPDIPHPNVVMIPQWRVCAALTQRLEELGGTVRYGRTLGAFTVGETGIEAAVVSADGGGESFTADYLVGCDGGHSMVRRALGISFDGESRPARYLLGDVTVDPLDPSVDAPDGGQALASHAWIAGDGTFLGLAGLPGTRRFQMGVGVGADEAVEPSVAVLQRLLRERSGRDDLTITDASWLSDFTVNIRLAARYRDGRVFLAGDAAHVHAPTGGQGMNAGIQDAYNLGWKLGLVLAGDAGEKLLDTYEAERRPVAVDVLARSTDILDVVATSNRIVSLLLERVLLPALSVPAINRVAVGRVSQVDVGYRGGPLAGPARGRIRPGDRAPDALVTELPSGRVLRLHDLLAGPEFVTLSWGVHVQNPVDLPRRTRHIRVADRADPAATTVRDHRGTLRKAYRPGRDEVIVIRPDGYVLRRGPHAGVTVTPVLSSRTATV